MVAGKTLLVVLPLLWIVDTAAAAPVSVEEILPHGYALDRIQRGAEDAVDSSQLDGGTDGARTGLREIPLDLRILQASRRKLEEKRYRIDRALTNS